MNSEIINKKEIPEMLASYSNGLKGDIILKFNVISLLSFSGLSVFIRKMPQ